MMASNRQIEANRENAKKSTGPKTDDGKARSRWNSRKHGLTAEVLVLRDEAADDFSELREALAEQYDPQTVMECELVDRMAGIVWRLRRVPTFEAGVLDYRVERVVEQERLRPDLEEGVQEEQDVADLLESSIRLGDALTDDFAFTNSLQKLGRHEASLMNALSKTHEMLERLQRSRRAAVEHAADAPPHLRAA